MESLEKLTTLDKELLAAVDGRLNAINGNVTRQMLVLRRELATQALKELWRELHLVGEPLIFASPGGMHIEHHPLLLDQLVASGKRRKKSRIGELASWQQLDVPAYAYGMASGDTDMLLKPDMLRRAEIGDRGTIPSTSYNWLTYTFSSGWTGLSVYLYYSEDSDSVELAAIPQGCQDEWLAFLKLLDDLHDAISRRERRGC